MSRAVNAESASFDHLMDFGDAVAPDLIRRLVMWSNIGTLVARDMYWTFEMERQLLLAHQPP